MKINKVNPEEFGVEKNKAKELTAGLTPHLQERNFLIEEFEQIKDLELTEENCKVFRELRLKFQKNRTQGIKNWHKKAKEIPLRLGQLIDAIKRNEESINQTYESKLEAGEKHFEILQQKLLESLQKERAELLDAYVEDAHERDLSSMDDDVWEAYLATKKQAYEYKIEAEKKAEAERLENKRLDQVEQHRRYEIAPYLQFINESPELREMKEKEYQKLLSKLKKAKSEREANQKRIREENERLRKEAEAEKSKQAKIEAERKAKEKAEREAYEAKLRKEREERKRIEKELKAKAEAEEKAIQDARLEDERKAKAPIKEKLNLWIDEMKLPYIDVENEVTREIQSKFASFKSWAKSQVKNI